MPPDQAAEIALLVASHAQREALDEPEDDYVRDDEIFEPEEDWLPRRHFSGRPFLKYPNGDA